MIKKSSIDISLLAEISSLALLAYPQIKQLISFLVTASTVIAQLSNAEIENIARTITVKLL